jgi:L-fucose/D-arabinose isomerase
MNPYIPKAILGFNGTERPGAVYLAAALAGHKQKGIPAFGIYGRHVQDIDDSTIQEDVKEKLLRFAKAGLAVAMMKGKSYLSIGSVSMGIAGSIVDSSFFESYLGMRNEYVDMSEIIRRIEEEIYDKDEYERALKWTKENCKEGEDNNPDNLRTSRDKKDTEWEFVVKMTIIIRDLMVGNKRLAEIGFIEESEGDNAIASGFQGQRQWNDHFPDGDFSEAILNSSFDWNGIREVFIVATENDSLNGVSMLFGHLLTNTAQIFADVRTYWSPEAVKRVTGKELTGKAANGIIHLINSGAATLDATGEQTKDGKPVMKSFWEITEQEVIKCLEATSWRPANRGYMRGGGYSSNFLTKGEMPVTMSRINLVKGLGPILQISEGYAVNIPDDIHKILDSRTDST